MKIFIVKFIIVFQFAFCGLVYAEFEEVDELVEGDARERLY